MKAMIFAAGMGTRLQPLTNSRPKALVEVNGVSMLERVIRRLISFGFTDLVINVHHFAPMVMDFLKSNNNFGVKISISDETDLLLDTGGGLLKAQTLLNDGEPFLIHNVDILTDFDLRALYQQHIQCKPLATMVVKNRKTSRSLLINEAGELSGWKNHQTGKVIISKGNEASLQPVAFSGVHVVSPEIFPLFTESGVFSIMDTYLRLASSHTINTWNQGDALWMDLGRVENLNQAEKYLSSL
jgi:NDP-sugar pyrophosphorylase family protein